MENNIEKAIFAGGCFWCTEAIFKRLKGVLKVTSGYSGGKRENPNYDQIHSVASGHAESIQIEFDPKQINFRTLLEVFFATHNPTTLNQQGYDVGQEYRSAIFYTNETQKKEAEQLINEIDNSHKFESKIVTELKPFTKFYPAENYHQDYYDKNKDYPYCKIIIDPKIKKLLEKFFEKVKEEYK